ncbi:MAG: hypothetical protein JW993_02730 [Sedimentisphaerales bacterium]|nr:hypothetical protein [Sedimentisphaerales bacterium]
MKTSSNYLVKVLATGFVVLLLFAIVLFWCRFGAEERLVVGMPYDAMRVQISPSGLLPDAVEREPNVSELSVASGTFAHLSLTHFLGLPAYVTSVLPGGSRSDVVHYDSDADWAYFDRTRGQMVLRKTDSQTHRVVTFYAGPDGMSDAPDAEHGRFVEPMIARSWTAYIVYDRSRQRFFAIDWRASSVRVGPPYAEQVPAEPVSIGANWRRGGLDVGWRPPMVQVPRARDPGDTQPQHESRFTMQFGFGDPGGYLPVVGASGRIDLLDCQSLKLIPLRASLPAPRTLYGQDSSRPSRLLEYGVQLVGVGRDAEYLGMVAGSVSRQGMSMALGVFDKSGRQIKAATTVLESTSRAGRPHVVPSERVALFGVPWAPALTVFKYALESMHPPVLTLASFFTADDVEARASHRALFLMPNSFVALQRDQVRRSIFAQLPGALWTMVPAFLLAGLLAWRVARDAAVVGLAGNTRAGWFVATLAFGLPAYITYRLTRLQAALVTCTNCGLPRRPDMDRCHRCRSLWRVPELVPPAWRVLDGTLPSSEQPEESEKNSAEPEQKLDSPVESM